MSKKVFKISGTGCALADFLYTKVDFSSPPFKKYQSLPDEAAGKIFNYYITLNINGINFNKGLGTHSYGEIVYTICCKYSKFESWVGIDNYHSDLGKGSAQFKIYGDNKLIFCSKILKINAPPEHILINIDKVNELKLVVTDAGDGIEYDHAVWDNAKLIVKGE